MSKRKKNQFLATMRDRPDRFLKWLDVEFGIKLAWEGGWGKFDKQQQIYFSVFDNPETYVRSAHSMGKMFCAGVVGNAFLFCKQPSKIIYLSTKMGQAKAQAWSEFMGLYKRIRMRLSEYGFQFPEPLSERVTFRNDWWAMVYTAKKEADTASQATAGFHAPNLLFILDEAPGIDDSIKQSVDGCRTSAGNRLLAQGNPVQRVGWYYDGQQDPPPYRKIIAISALESPNVITGEDIVPGLATPGWVEQVKNDYGEGSAYWFAHVLGEFPQEDEWSLVAWQHIQAAADRWREFDKAVKALGYEDWPQMVDQEGASEAARIIKTYAHENGLSCPLPDLERLAIGVDVADTGNDSSVITVLAGDLVVERIALQSNDVMTVVGKVVQVLKKYDVWACAVDKPGVGTGVVRRLQELGVSVLEYLGHVAPENKEEYQYLGDELAWSLRKRFRDGLIAIPDDDVLKQECATMRWTQTSAGKVRVPKPKRKSPDHFDSLRIAHWMEQMGAWDPEVISLPVYRHEEWDLDGF